MSCNEYGKAEFGKYPIDWNIGKLSEFISVLTDYHSNGSYKKLKENVELLDKEDYAIMIRTTNFEQGAFNKSDFKYISESAYDFLEKTKVYKNDILMNKIANAGSVYIVPELDKPVSLAMNLFLIRMNTELINQKYAYYFMKNYEKYIKTRAQGSVTKTITKDNVRQLEIAYPTIIEQNKIVNVISSIEKKIKLNNEMNKTLEEMAQALFKRWFVDFEFANEDGEPYKSSGGEMVESEIGMIPKGWKIYSVIDLVDSISVKHKFNKDKIIFLNTSDILDGEVLTNEYSEVSSLPGQAKKSIQKNDILYSEIRPKNKRYAFIDFECEDYVVSTKLMVLRVKSILSPTLMYQFLTSSDTVDYLQSIAESRSGTFPQITFKELEKLKISLPGQAVLLKWNNTISSLFYSIQENKRESKSLSELRDSLLPKLMSGEIRVEDIEASL